MRKSWWILLTMIRKVRKRQPDKTSQRIYRLWTELSQRMVCICHQAWATPSLLRLANRGQYATMHRSYYRTQVTWLSNDLASEPSTPITLQPKLEQASKNQFNCRQYQTAFLSPLDDLSDLNFASQRCQQILHMGHQSSFGRAVYIRREKSNFWFPCSTQILQSLILPWETFTVWRQRWDTGSPCSRLTHFIGWEGTGYHRFFIVLQINSITYLHLHLFIHIHSFILWAHNALRIFAFWQDIWWVCKADVIICYKWPLFAFDAIPSLHPYKCRMKVLTKSYSITH